MADVYTGVWIDHAQNKLILTLDQKSSGFLTAAIVSFVNIVAILTWPIFRYLLYAVRNTRKGDKTVFHHQRQVLLRNSSSAGGTVAQLLKLIFSWRSHKRTAFFKNFLYLVTCLVIFLLWLVCGLYAPYIYTRTSNDVLVAKNPWCGFVIFNTSTDSLTDLEVFNSASVNLLSAADTYSQSCYSGTNNNSQCNSYAKPSLSYNSTLTSCPFAGGDVACQTVNSSVITLDTGLLDSSDDFGINAFQEDRVKYRRVVTCSPLKSVGFATLFNSSSDPTDDLIPGTIWIRYNYGSTFFANTVLNYTLSYPSYQGTISVPYFYNTYYYQPGVASPSWIPAAALQANYAADVYLGLLESNAVTYTEPVYDPLFLAGTESYAIRTLNNTDGTTSVYYEGDVDATALGCTEQHQICIKTDSGNECTPLASFAALYNASMALGPKRLNSEQQAAMIRLSTAASASKFLLVSENLGANSMLAFKTLSDLTQTAALPIYQWELEVKNWFNISLAALQAEVVSYATGPNNDKLRPLTRYLDTEAGVRQCSTQRIQNPSGHYNFDLAALIILVVLGAFLALLGLLFERIMGLFGRFSKRGRERHSEWTLDGLFQLHRAKLEAQGVEGWQRIHSDHPVSSATVRPASFDAPSRETNGAYTLVHAPTKE